MYLDLKDTSAVLQLAIAMLLRAAPDQAPLAQPMDW
jgi:hypothetical protein